MKTLTRTIILLVTVNLIITNMAIAQDSYGEQAEADQVDVAAERTRGEAVDMILPQTTRRGVAIGTSRVRVPSLRGSSSEAVLVIPTAEMELEDLASITEDMTIMSRIFDKKIGQLVKRGFNMVMYGDEYRPFIGFGRSSGTSKTIYLEGYGALFLMRVDFPLVQPPVEQEEEETEEEEDADPVWIEATQEIYAPQELERRRRADRSDVEEYDAEKVEELKQILIKTLKHAKNIRALKTDESVILTIVGKTIQSDTIVTRVYDTVVPEMVQTDISSPTILTIRAKKSDIDAFANDELSFEQFSKQIQVLTYSLLGESGDSMQSPSSSTLPGVEGRRRARSSGTRRARR